MSRGTDECLIKLFVGSIPYASTEEELLPIFSQFGEAKELTIQRHRDGKSKGCAWLKYATKKECQAAINGLHKKYYVGNMSNPLQIKYAFGEKEKADNKLFIGGLPYSADEKDLLEAFKQFGDVTEVHLICKKDGSSNGACFVKFSCRDDAQSLINKSRPVVISEQACPNLRISWASSKKPQNNQFNMNNNNMFMGGLHLGLGHMNLGMPFGNHGHPPMGRFSQGNAHTGYKLFVGCLPYSRDEADLHYIFSQFGPLLDIVIMREQGGKSKGAGFVKFVALADAQRCISQLNNLFSFPNSPRAIQVSFAKGTNTNLGHLNLGLSQSLGIPFGNSGQNVVGGFGQGSVTSGHKLFVGSLPYSKDETDLHYVFSQFGPILDVVILREQGGKSTGAGFVKFVNLNDAQGCIAQLNDRFVFPNSPRAIQVSFAKVNS